MTQQKTQKVELPESCLRWSFDGSRARCKSDGPWVKFRDYEDMRNFANARMCAAQSLEAAHLQTKEELEKAQQAFTELRLADQEAIAETLAAALEQQQLKEAAVKLRDEWSDEYTKVRDELEVMRRSFETACADLGSHTGDTAQKLMSYYLEEKG